MYVLNHMPADEFLEWVQFAQLEPFGEGRADWRAAMQAAVAANIARDPKKQRALTVKDFMPKIEEPRKVTGKKQTVEEQLFIARVATAKFKAAARAAGET